ncbi:metal ABC transporter substrate-binding protein [bacterium]|nr:metal ABC transporter substrate-binding protein [bacterium]
MLLGAAALAESPLLVCATIPDLGDLARQVGGDQVAVTVFAKGTDDAHFVDAKPSFIKELSRADLFIQNGLDLEIGWAPALINNARNAAVLPGGKGYLDASKAVTPMEVRTTPTDRSMGDVHPMGNSHYLMDPLNGVKVAALIRDRLSELRPAKRAYFAERFEQFRKTVGEALVGPELAARYDFEKLAALAETGRLDDFLAGQKEAGPLSGWLGATQPLFGAKAVSDHNLWPYFARRFGIQVVDFMEPKPGISPTTKHLQEVIANMKSQGVRLVIAAAYYDPRHAEFVARNTGARIVTMAHMVGALDGTSDYVAMIDANVRQLVGAAKP